MTGTFPLIAVFLGIFVGPALLAGFVAFVAGRARAGVAAAVILLATVFVYAMNNPSTESGEQNTFSAVLVTFVLTPSLALAIAASFIGAALRRRES
ncbi:MAG: hypothetical protein R3B97_17220 [Dehalococcoidia bacterium]|nr:hypothetical protein [Dehalococcoidia bacterium]MCA9829527.1 hypothetical protein [Dehalococcoidia bacterium]